MSWEFARVLSRGGVWVDIVRFGMGMVVLVGKGCCFFVFGYKGDIVFR